jgi:hypothetical protein
VGHHPKFLGMIRTRTYLCSGVESIGRRLYLWTTVMFPLMASSPGAVDQKGIVPVW